MRRGRARSRTRWTRGRGDLVRGRLDLVSISLACVLWPGLAPAQTTGFNPADYGRAQLPSRQSTGDAAAYVETNKGAFEPVAELDRGDALAKLARPIGRIDVVLHNAKTGEDIGASCTGSLLPDDHVLTNHHCLPQEGDLRPVKASILMDYLTLDGKGSKRFELDPKPVEWSAALDYAIAGVRGRPAVEYGTVRIGGTPVAASRSLLVVHHPLGRPKVMSRFRCFAVRDQEAGPELRHHCDTLGGSSGSLLFDFDQMGIALHKEGGLDPTDPTSYNTATRMAALLAASPILRKAASQSSASAPTPVPGTSAAPPPAAAAPSGLAPGDMNAILRGR